MPIEAPGADVAPRATAQRQLRILAVDDEPALTKAVVRLLRPIGHLVTTASSGEEALEQLAAQPFDVVLSDVGMGAGMSGWDLAERVRDVGRRSGSCWPPAGAPGSTRPKHAKKAWPRCWPSRTTSASSSKSSPPPECPS